MSSSIYQSIKDVVKSLGIVFGDIGTSPMYAITAAFELGVITPTIANIMGILSLFIWTMVVIVSIQYAWLAMSLEKEGEGEGGTIVLQEILIPLLKSRKLIILVTALSFIGIAFFIGDGIITPAVSILSAVEGLKFIGGGFSQNVIVIAAIIITIALFAFQSRGTEKVSMAFGPIMLIWFLFLGFMGILFVFKNPNILWSINPLYGLRFLFNHGFIGILLLSKVILCATGGEALYADMGHLGRKPIIRAWVFVFISLTLVYLGQGVFYIENPGVQNIFHEMVLYKFDFLYIPLVLLSIVASVIASQSVISGLFSVVYQGINTHIIPRLHVEYTSEKKMSQIYIPFANSFLMIFVLLTIINFRTVENLANAYGLAVSGTMTITAIFLTFVFVLKRHVIKSLISFCLIFINALFLFANTYKLSGGGYWSLIAACFPLSLILIYTLGRRKLNKSLKQMPFEFFVEKFKILSQKIPHINGTAVFFAKNVEPVPVYIAQTMFTNNIIYEDNVIVFVVTQKSPFGVTALFKKEPAPGLRIFEIRVGYKEIINIEKILIAADIHPKVIFYGVEDISTKNIVWRLFTIIKKLTPSFVQFYKLPRSKLHGVIVRAEM